MSSLVTKTAASCFAVLRQLRGVRRSLSLISLVVVLVLLWLDYCNTVLESQLDSLQAVLNPGVIHVVSRMT
jgi:hypothetical protein